MKNFDFANCLAFVLMREGGYVNNPRDRGGATNRGITQRTYDRYRIEQDKPVQDVANINPAEVSEIYHKHYWVLSCCPAMPPPVNLVHFDSAVNHGPLRAAKLLQETIQAPVDGLIGQDTMRAVGIADPMVLAENYIDVRREFYREIVSRNPAQAVFLRGWLNRMAELEREMRR